ncbi:MAG: hypothetical protein JSR97_13250 [Verrucomicrobia bacterium]|nr:hypothetical protein [Verrucomicrobiota bacterium]
MQQASEPLNSMTTAVFLRTHQKSRKPHFERVGKIISKMRLAIVLLIFSPIVALGQQQKILAKFIITDATINNEDVTETYLDAGGYIAFYISEGGNFCMTNIMSNRYNSQSYGLLYSAQTKSLNETYKNYKADFFYYKWRYINTYDSKKGTATVKLIKVYKPQGVTFVCTIIPENLDVLVYKGYMEGTLDFSEYNN